MHGDLGYLLPISRLFHDTLEDEVLPAGKEPLLGNLYGVALPTTGRLRLVQF